MLDDRGIFGTSRWGRMGGMSAPPCHVWVLVIATDYEGEEHLGVFASKGGAVAAALAYLERQAEHASPTPQKENDEQVSWRFSDMFTLYAIRREVGP